MMQQTRRRTPRNATALVEFAVIAVIFVMMFFGIFEYARFVFLLQTADNAAREGARFAVARTGDGTTKQQVIDEVNARMVGRAKELAGYKVEVLNVDPDTGLEVEDSDWNEAKFGSAIEVRISGSYTPILPTLLLASPSIKVQRSSLMSSEAN
jgi:hypothetical protein